MDRTRRILQEARRNFGDVTWNTQKTGTAHSEPKKHFLSNDEIGDSCLSECKENSFRDARTLSQESENAQVGEEWEKRSENMMVFPGVQPVPLIIDSSESVSFYTLADVQIVEENFVTPSADETIQEELLPSLAAEIIPTEIRPVLSAQTVASNILKNLLAGKEVSAEDTQHLDTYIKLANGAGPDTNFEDYGGNEKMNTATTEPISEFQEFRKSNNQETRITDENVSFSQAIENEGIFSADAITDFHECDNALMGDEWDKQSNSRVVSPILQSALSSIDYNDSVSDSQPIPYMGPFIFGGESSTEDSNFQSKAMEQTGDHITNENSSLVPEDLDQAGEHLTNENSNFAQDNFEPAEDDIINDDIPEPEITANKKERNWKKKKTYCKFCSKHVTHFTRHLTTFHSDEDEVVELRNLMFRSEVYSQELASDRKARQQSKQLKADEEGGKKSLASTGNKKGKKNSPAKRLPDETVEELKKKFKEINGQVRAISIKLRSQGAYQLNLTAPPTGEIIPTKRPNHMAYTPTRLTHAPCTNCLKTLRIDNLPAHLAQCISSPDNDEDPEIIEATRKRVLKTSLQLLNVTPEGVSEEFKSTILNGMRNNLVTLIAQSDPLILEVGQRFFESHRLPKHVKQVRKIIRDLARLYIAVDEIQDEEEEGGTCIESSQIVKDLTDCIDPLKFDIVAKALQALAGYDAKTGAVKVASVSGRYSNPLKICADVLLSNAYQSKTLLESDKNAIKEKMQKWLHVLRFEWQYKIGSICETSRKINVASKEEVIPLDEDIRKLSLQVESLYPVTIEMLKKEKSAKNFVALCRLIIVDIILLCRRRPTEVCHATLLAYSRLVFQDEKEANADYLTDADKKVGGLLKIFYVPGKGNVPVPILVTSLMEEGITLLKECRGQFQLKSEDNDLLFPVPFTGGAYDGSIIFSEFVRKGKLQKPQLLNCRSLRRHIATASQLQRYDATATKNLATFMGHTGNIHDEHYRRPLAHVHRIQIGARLLSFRKPASKPTEEGSNKPENVDSIPHTATSTTPVSCNSSIDLPTEDLNAGNSPQSDTESTKECANKVFDEENEAQSEFQVSPREEQMESSQSDDGQEANEQKRLRVLSEEYDSQSSDGSEFEAPKKKKMKKARWSDEDKNLIFLHFGEQIKAGINPPRHKVKKVYENNPSLRSRQLNAVVTYIYCLAGKNNRK